MSLKVPVFYGRRRGPQTGAGILDAEILAEMASSIGRTGRALEKALGDLRAHDEDSGTDRQKRGALLQAAADRAWALFVQYDMAGLSSQSQLVKRYGIPGEVLVRVGIRKK